MASSSSSSTSATTVPKNNQFIGMSKLEMIMAVNNLFKSLDSLISDSERAKYRKGQSKGKGKGKSKKAVEKKPCEEIYDFIRLQSLFNHKDIQTDQKRKFSSMFYQHVVRYPDNVFNVIKNDDWLYEDFVVYGKDINPPKENTPSEDAGIPYNINLSFFLNRAKKLREEVELMDDAGHKVEEERENDFLRDFNLIIQIYECFSCNLVGEPQKKVRAVIAHYKVICNEEEEQSDNLLSNIMNSMGVPTGLSQGIKNINIGEMITRSMESNKIKGVMKSMFDFNKQSQNGDDLKEGSVNFVADMLDKLKDPEIIEEVKNLLPTALTNDLEEKIIEGTKAKVADENVKPDDS